MPKKEIIIRCDANEQNGYGHFSRCLNIARGIKENAPNVTIIFCGNYSKEGVRMLNHYRFSQIPFKPHNPKSAKNLSKFLYNTDCLILDTYLITQNYIDELCGKKYKFVVIDDYNQFNLSKVDLVANFSMDAINMNYRTKEQALGLNYFPFKPELKKIRENKLKSFSDKMSNILVIIGGYDKFKTGNKIVGIIDNLIIGASVTMISKDDAEKPTMKNNTLKILPFQNKIETLYSIADIVISGGGFSKYESAFCCIPNGNTPQTPEELLDSKILSLQGISYTIGLAYRYNKNRFNIGVKSLLKPTRRKQLYSNCSSIFYLNSLENLANKILS